MVWVLLRQFGAIACLLGMSVSAIDREGAVASPNVAGDHRAAPPGFVALFDAHCGGVVGMARLLGSDDPEDAAAEAFVRLYENWSTLRDRPAALAYVRATVARMCSNRRRHLAVVARHARRGRPGSHPSAESAVLQRARGDALLVALQGLTATRRTAVVLRFYAGLDYEEIGRALGCRASTARSHVARGLDNLRGTWNSEGEQV